MEHKKIIKLLKKPSIDTPCISIYIPTYRAGNLQEDKLRFKNALSEAVQQLMDNQLFSAEKMNKEAAQNYLEPAYTLLKDEDFWKYLSDGLVIFLGENEFVCEVAPIDFQPLVYVHNHYYLSPLLSLLNKNNRFFVLALSQNEVRFFEGTDTSITPVVIDDLMPNGISEVLKEENVSGNLQGRSSGKGTTIYHGHGGGKDDKNENLKKYFRAIDEGLMEMLHDENAPLVLYSVDSQIPIYKEVSNYPHIIEASISGNSESEDSTLIHEKAWSVIANHFSEQKQLDVDIFNNSLAKDKASCSIHDIVPAAMNGKVDTIFMDKKSGILWGNYNEKSNTTELHSTRQSDSTCLFNQVVVATCLNGGTIYNIPLAEMPNDKSSINAYFRY
jgi:hypothetical protein